MSISPWDYRVAVTSPDGQITARIDHASEVGMGAPTFGVLRLSTGLQIDSCNPSIVWSHDSRFLAVPQWTRDRMQKLLVVRVDVQEVRAFERRFDVLQLESFADGIISAIDSPIYRPVRVSLAVRDIFPDAGHSSR